MKKIKPIFKSKLTPQPEWVLSFLPKECENLHYVEPFGGPSSLFLNKKKTFIEIINNEDSDIIHVYRALRDEPKEYLKRLSTIKCNKDTFEKALKKIHFDDYLDHAVNEFVLRKMSHDSNRKNFKSQNQNVWANNVKNLNYLSERIKESYIYNKEPFEIIKNFNCAETVLFVIPPDQDNDNHIGLFNTLKDFKGKVVVYYFSSPFYNDLYSSWDVKRKKETKKGLMETIWKNF